MMGDISYCSVDVPSRPQYCRVSGSPECIMLLVYYENGLIYVILTCMSSRETIVKDRWTMVKTKGCFAVSVTSVKFISDFTGSHSSRF